MRFDNKLISLNRDFSFDDSGLRLPMDIQFAFGPYFHYIVVRVVDLLNNLSAEFSCGEFFALHIILIEVLALQLTVESLERLNIHQEGELISSWINHTLHFV